MKIAYISTYPPTKCGIAEYTYFLCMGLSKRLGSKVDITIFSDINGVSASPPENVIPSFRPGKGVYRDLIDNVRERGPFDIIHIQHEYGHHPIGCMEFLESLKRLRECTRSLVITLHKVFHTIRGDNIVNYQKAICELVDNIVVHSTIQEFELWSQGVDPLKITRIPHGTTINKQNTDLDLGVEVNDRFVLTMSGFIRMDKGCDILLRALRKLIEKHSEVLLILAGEHQKEVNREYANSVLRAARKLKDNVLILNKFLSREEMLALLNISDVVIFPYRDWPGHIGISGAFHLAIGSFKPTICTRVARLIECYELAPSLTVPPKQADALAEKIEFAMENRESVERAFKPLKDYAIKTNWENVALKHYKLYERLLNSS